MYAPIEIKGSLTMLIGNATEFLTDTAAQDGVKAGIASAHSTSGHTIAASSVKLVVTKGRRLAARERRLLGPVRIAYTITLRVDKSTQEAIQQLAVTSTPAELTAAIKMKVQETKGSSYARVIFVTDKSVHGGPGANPSRTTATGQEADASRGSRGAHAFAGIAVLAFALLVVPA